VEKRLKAEGGGQATERGLRDYGTTGRRTTGLLTTDHTLKS
jgi:hypothetical protein